MHKLRYQCVALYVLKPHRIYLDHAYLVYVLVLFRFKISISENQFEKPPILKVFENKCHRRMLLMSYREHKTNECVLHHVDILAGCPELVLITVNRHKLSWFGHVCHDTLPKIILQGTVDGRRRGKPRKSWNDNIKEWTGRSMSSLLPIADDKGRCAGIAADASVRVPPTTPGCHGYLLVSYVWITLISIYISVLLKFIILFFKSQF